MSDTFKEFLQLNELLGGALPGAYTSSVLSTVQKATQAEEQEDGEDVSDEETAELPDEDLDLDDEVPESDDPDRQGVIRTVDNAHMVFKRENEEGTFDELWIYNVGSKMEDELVIRRNILAGTDIPPKRSKSQDGSQSYTLTTMGDAQLLYIAGLPQ